MHDKHLGLKWLDRLAPSSYVEYTTACATTYYATEQEKIGLLLMASVSALIYYSQGIV